ncbi:MAG: phosphodiester glycosidase family protein [Armatimonadetes bacterium]|nr:phosphodiester glycosidase family protein [Armatimonadota bacterium]
MPNVKPNRRAVIGSLIATVAGVAVNRSFCAAPAPLPSRPLYRGVSYRRIVWHSPRPVVFHILVVQTQTPGLRFFVTPPDYPGTDKPLRARTTSAFLREYRLQAVVNADFFYPWKSKGCDYYPHVGDRVTVEGDAVSEGVRYADRDAPNLATLHLSKTNRPSLKPPNSGEGWNAVGGRALLRNHKSLALDEYAQTATEPRTAAGWTPSGDALFLICVDGRQAGYSEGVTLAELAVFFQSLGATDAINLDGGGSTAMVVSDGGDGSRLLNRPIDQRVPGKERVVANHLGIYAPPL